MAVSPLVFICCISLVPSIWGSFSDFSLFPYQLWGEWLSYHTDCLPMKMRLTFYSHADTRVKGLPRGESLSTAKDKCWQHDCSVDVDLGLPKRVSLGWREERVSCSSAYSGSEVEKVGLEPVTIWDASDTGDNFTAMLQHWPLSEKF